MKRIAALALTLLVAGTPVAAHAVALSLSVAGYEGEVMRGAVPLVDPVLPAEYERLMAWADAARTLAVRANADTPEDAERARAFGAQGIGLCRTEHMFFGKDRIAAVREMILSTTVEGREKALAKIEPFQRADFVGIFEAMDGYPVTIRLLDPPLHEFLPQKENVEGAEEVARQMGVPLSAIRERVDELHEFNPMMGFRGCRLPIVFPEIGDMQVRAIIEAAIEVQKKGKKVLPEIMIPLVGIVEELKLLKARAIAVADEAAEVRARTAAEESGGLVDIQVGPLDHLPFPDAAYDLVVVHGMSGTLGGGDKGSEATRLIECGRVLRTGGRIVALTAGPRQGFAALFKSSPPADTGPDAAAALSAAGFKPVRVVGELDGFRFTEGLKT